MGFVSNEGDARITGVTVEDEFTRVDISYNAQLVRTLDELNRNGVSQSAIDNWLGADFRVGVPDLFGGEASLTYNPALNQVKVVASGNVSLLGGGVELLVQLDEGGQIISVDHLGFAGLQTTYGFQLEAFGIIVGESGKAQLGLFFEGEMFEAEFFQNPTVGATINHSQGFLLSSGDVEASTEIVSLSDLTLEDLVSLVSEIHMADGYSEQMASIRAAGFAMEFFPREQVNSFIFDQIVGQECFLRATEVDMWSRSKVYEPSTVSDASSTGIDKGDWQKPIEDIVPGDIVVSFDKDGHRVPGMVTRTFTKDVKIVLDFFGTGVTPGHVYYRADGAQPNSYETLIDILRADGVIEKQDGTQIRAATGLPLDDPRDGFVRAVTGTQVDEGDVMIREQGQIRLGTRVITEDGKDLCVGDLIAASGGIITEDGLVSKGDTAAPFYWAFGETLPKPEDYVLQRSGTTLEDIYKASEWEERRPHLPPPMVREGGPVRAASAAELSAMPRNAPLSETSETYSKAERPMLNRKARKALNAKKRRAQKKVVH